MGKPAARITDMHICPKVNPGPVPHVGGPIVMGSPNVLIGSLPAARVGDMAVCVGPPDKVSSGSTGVLINGKQAARLGDSTAHGGKIIVGMPTVLVGGGGGGGGSTGGGTDTNVKSTVKAGTDVGGFAGLPEMKNFLATSLAESVVAQASNVEPKVTSAMKEVAADNNAEMEGLEYRLKSSESLSRKIATDSMDQNISMPEAADNISDALRYTMIVDEAQFGETAKNVISSLETKGYKKVRVKNTFKDGAVYKGINTNLESPDGQILELQFHTKESFNIKQNVNHKLYEEARLPSTTVPKQKQLVKQMQSNSAKIKQPKNVDSIKNYP